MKDEMVVTQTDILEAKLSKERVPEVYSAKARFYDVWGKFTESKAQERSLEIAKIQDGETVLEVAVGTGLTFKRVLRRNPSGWNEGVDVTAAMLAKRLSTETSFGAAATVPATLRIACCASSARSSASRAFLTVLNSAPLSGAPDQPITRTGVDGGASLMFLP